MLACIAHLKLDFGWTNSIPHCDSSLNLYKCLTAIIFWLSQGLPQIDVGHVVSSSCKRNPILRSGNQLYPLPIAPMPQVNWILQYYRLLAKSVQWAVKRETEKRVHNSSDNNAVNSNNKINVNVIFTTTDHSFWNDKSELAVCEQLSLNCTALSISHFSTKLRIFLPVRIAVPQNRLKEQLIR